MESYEIDVIKMEKLKAMKRYLTFRKIANTVRTLEIFIAIMIVSWLISSVSAYMPAAVEFAGKFLRRVSSLFFSPHFVFVLGNVIVITLFAKSSDRTSACENLAVDVLSGEEPVEEGEKSKDENSVAVNETVTVPAEEEEEDRESERKTYERTRSSLEMVTVDERENKKKELRRSETEPRRKIGNRESTAAKRTRMYEVDELSNDEFRRKVEAFIEKQQRLLREESKSVVIFSNNRCNSL